MGEYYKKSIKEIFSEFKTTQTGLTSLEAEKRIGEFGTNELKKAEEESPFKIFLEQFNDYIIWILIAAVIISSVLGEWTDAIVIAVILILNAVLGFVQEYKAEKAIDALQKMSSLKAIVLRDGKEKEIEAKDVVPGDIMILEEGEKVPADARLFENSELHTQEAALTGESTPVEKILTIFKDNLSIGDQKNSVFAGTNIASGRGKAVVVSTGMNTELGKIAGIIQSSEMPLTPLQIKLKSFGKMLGFIVIAICIIVFIAGLLRGEPALGMFLAAVSLAVAAVPEGLPAVVTITLAIGVQKMIKKNALIRKLPSVETLGATTVICSDKTGTLTHNEMTVKKIYADNTVIDVTGEGYNTQGTFSAQTKSLKQLLKIGLLCNNAQLDNGKVLGDPTEGALIVSALKLGLNRADLELTTPRVREIPFSSERKMMSTIHQIKHKKFILTKGAPDTVLQRCNRVLEDGEVRVLTTKVRAKLLAQNEDFASQALRVIGFAYKEAERDDLQEGNLIFVGLQAMIDPPRSEVKDSIRKCHEAGIKVVMITGDHKLTAEAIAKDLGIPGRSLTGQELAAIKQEDLDAIIEKVGVFARVEPSQKVKIVESFKRLGHIVAMTGDGVNDAPALKTADIGIAMGITGTDVAKEASGMILTDDNFTSIVNAVEEGRGIFDNIQKFVEYLLSCNLGEVMVIFFAILIGLKLPLIAIMILLMNLLTDGLPALAIAMEPEEPDLMRKAPRKTDARIVSGKGLVRMLITGIIMTVGTLGVFIYSNPSQNLEYAQTMAFTTVVLFQLFQALNCRSLHRSIFSKGFLANRWIYASIAISVLLQLIIIYTPLNSVFHTVPLLWFDWGIVLLVSASILVIREVMKLFEV